MPIAVPPSSAQMVLPTASEAASDAPCPDLHAHLHALGDHDGVVHQHAQGNHQGAQGYALQLDARQVHDEQRSGDGDQQHASR
jgi:hypothetical protein